MRRTTRKKKERERAEDNSLVAVVIFMIFTICTAVSILMDWCMAGGIFHLLMWLSIFVAISLKPPDE